MSHHQTLNHFIVNRCNIVSCWNFYTPICIKHMFWMFGLSKNFYFHPSTKKEKKNTLFKTACNWKIWTFPYFMSQIVFFVVVAGSIYFWVVRLFFVCGLIAVIWTIMIPTGRRYDHVTHVIKKLKTGHTFLLGLLRFFHQQDFRGLVRRLTRFIVLLFFC